MLPRTRLAALFLFAITMALFEAAVVAYLRRLWELGEVDIGGAALSSRFYRTEMAREAASLGMIASVAFLSGRRAIERLAHVAIVFGCWDILYYAFLRALTGWPTSLLDWDVLFLIPRAWIGPVLAPILVSFALFGGGLAVAHREATERPVRPVLVSWIGAILGGGIVVSSFLISEVPRSPSDSPTGFSWLLFAAGMVLALGSLAHALSRSERQRGAGRSSAIA